MGTCPNGQGPPGQVLHMKIRYDETESKEKVYDGRRGCARPERHAQTAQHIQGACASFSCRPAHQPDWHLRMAANRFIPDNRPDAHCSGCGYGRTGVPFCPALVEPVHGSASTCGAGISVDPMRPVIYLEPGAELHVCAAARIWPATGRNGKHIRITLDGRDYADPGRLHV